MFWRHILTSDPQSSIYDLVRVITWISFLVVVGFTLWDHLLIEWFTAGKRTPFDVVHFGQAVALILAAGGGAMWARNDKEGRKNEG